MGVHISTTRLASSSGFEALKRATPPGEDRRTSTSVPPRRRIIPIAATASVVESIHTGLPEPRSTASSSPIFNDLGMFASRTLMSSRSSGVLAAARFHSISFVSANGWYSSMA